MLKESIVKRIRWTMTAAKSSRLLTNEPVCALDYVFLELHFRAKSMQFEFPFIILHEQKHIFEKKTKFQLQKERKCAYYVIFFGFSRHLHIAHRLKS